MTQNLLGACYAKVKYYSFPKNIDCFTSFAMTLFVDLYKLPKERHCKRSEAIGVKRSLMKLIQKLE